MGVMNMFLEKLFGNTFGLIWLIVFVVAVFALIAWLFVKKEKVVIEDKIEEIVNNNDEIVEEATNNKEKVIEEKVEVKEEPISGEYEIIESEDGFFRVRKIGNERTLRKFATRIEAENFIEKRGLKND